LVSTGTHQARGLALADGHQDFLYLGEYPKCEAEQNRLDAPAEGKLSNVALDMPFGRQVWRFQ
jgi:hypothetical protein